MPDRPAHAQTESQGDAATYTVVAGDTLFLIAERFGVPMEAIIAANGIVDPNLLEVGQVLIIPIDTQGGELPADLTVAEGKTVRAMPGDTLAFVARRYAQDESVVSTLNNAEPTARLFPGQPVLLPATAVVEEPLRFGAVSGVNLPPQVVQGKTGKLIVETYRPLDLAATWNGLPIAFTLVNGNPLRQSALLPIPALLAPAAYPVILSYTATNNQPVSRTWNLPVVEGDYDTQDIVLPPDRGGLLEPEVVQAELEKVTAVWSQISPELLWTQPFSRPVGTEYATTSPYGTRRSYNSGPVSSYHAGQDFGVPEGIPALAPGDGVVVLAEPLDVRGNAVIIDHGRGIFSGYWHLSELAVAPGQNVRVGDVMGLVGNTGLSTGAHLHWELRIYGVAVDPLQFLGESFLR